MRRRRRHWRVGPDDDVLRFKARGCTAYAYPHPTDRWRWYVERREGRGKYAMGSSVARGEAMSEKAARRAALKAIAKSCGAR